MADKASEGRSARSRSRSKRGRETEGAGDERAPPPPDNAALPRNAPLPQEPLAEEEDRPTTPGPQTLGDYVIVARLGGGGMADVFLAHKTSRFGFVRRAVIKRVRRARPGYKNLQRMLLDEARATACFDHPNLVSIIDIGEDSDGVYIALEYVEGTDLRWVNNKLRARKEALPFELACHTVVEVLRGLHHAHTVRGADGQPLEIVHRDVNPANVLVSYSGHVKLADFGVVLMRDRIQHETEAGLVKGKYAYLAPEYIAGESCTHLSDIYAAGIMLFELLSGRECFSGTTTYEVMWKIVNRGVPMYRIEREGVPEELCRIVQRATNPVPERRFTTAQEMANSLETWLMRSGKHATPWVLSVFFARHELFPSREEMAASQVVPGLARSVHAVRRDIEPAEEWSEETPHQQIGEVLRHRDLVGEPMPPPELEDAPAFPRGGDRYLDVEGAERGEPMYAHRPADRGDQAAMDAIAEQAALRLTSEASTQRLDARAPSPPAEAISMPAIDMQQAMIAGVRVHFAMDQAESEARGAARVLDDHWASDRPTPVPEAGNGVRSPPAPPLAGGPPPRMPAPITAHSGRTPAPMVPSLAAALAAAQTLPATKTPAPLPRPPPAIAPAATTISEPPEMEEHSSAEDLSIPPAAIDIPQDYFFSDGPGAMTPPEGMPRIASPSDASRTRPEDGAELSIEEPDEPDEPAPVARMPPPLHQDSPPPDEMPTPRPDLEPEPAPGPRGTVLWSGKLEEISAAEALDQLTRAGASGSLEFRCGLIWKRVQLDQGTPIAITSNMGMELIGEHLVKARILTRRELDRALHAADRDGQALTAKLLELGLIERPRLEEELGKNLSARLSEVLEWRWGTFEFAPQPPETAAIRPRLDLHRIIQNAVEARARAEAEERAGDEVIGGDSDQSRLKEAFQRARSIAQSTGKGRVEEVGAPGVRQSSPKR